MPLSPHQFSHRRSFPRRPRSESLTKHPRYDNPCLLTTCHGFQTRFKLTDRLLKALAGSAAVDGCASQGAGWRGGDTCDDSLIDWFFFSSSFFFPWMFSCRASKRHSSLEFLELVLWKCCKWTRTHTNTYTNTHTNSCCAASWCANELILRDRGRGALSQVPESLIYHFLSGLKPTNQGKNTQRQRKALLHTPVIMVSGFFFFFFWFS